MNQGLLAPAEDQRRVTSAATQTSQWLVLECGYCNAKGGQYLGHYDVVRCRCGKSYWALRPFRDGPLKLFEWPGIRMNGVVVK